MTIRRPRQLDAQPWPLRSLLRLLAFIAFSGCTTGRPVDAAPQKAPVPSQPSGRFQVEATVPDAAIVLSANIRRAIGETGAPWRVFDRQTGASFVLVPTLKLPVVQAIVSWPMMANLTEDFESPPQGLYVAETELTERQAALIRQAGFNAIDVGGDLPLLLRHWDDADALARAAACRLPTEGEWLSFAMLGCMHGAPSGCWTAGNSAGKAHRVGELCPNGVGLYDVTGNVPEWIAGAFGELCIGAAPPDMAPGDIWRAYMGDSVFLHGPTPTYPFPKWGAEPNVDCKTGLRLVVDMNVVLNSLASGPQTETRR